MLNSPRVPPTHQDFARNFIECSIEKKVRLARALETIKLTKAYAFAATVDDAKPEKSEILTLSHYNSYVTKTIDDHLEILERHHVHLFQVPGDPSYMTLDRTLNELQRRVGHLLHNPNVPRPLRTELEKLSTKTQNRHSLDDLIKLNTILNKMDLTLVSIDQSMLEEYNTIALRGGITHLTPTIMRILRQHINLDMLILHDNNLATLPDSIGNFIELHTLIISENQFSILPNVIGELIALRSLLARDNQLTTLFDSIGNLTKLRSLNLGDNKLSHLPAATSRLIQLDFLFLAGNAFSALPEAITNLPRLEHLRFDFDILTTVPKRFLPVLKATDNLQNVRHLTKGKPKKAPSHLSSLRTFISTLRTPTYSRPTAPLLTFAFQTLEIKGQHLDAKNLSEQKKQTMKSKSSPRK